MWCRLVLLVLVAASWSTSASAGPAMHGELFGKSHFSSRFEKQRLGLKASSHSPANTLQMFGLVFPKPKRFSKSSALRCSPMNRRFGKKKAFFVRQPRPPSEEKGRCRSFSMHVVNLVLTRSRTCSKLDSSVCLACVQQTPR